jgi:peptidoglycan/xylan/chitin deacetylase (PgdA/CDA1 family)
MSRPAWREPEADNVTTVCLTFDFDAVSIWVSTFKQVSASPVSRGEFGPRVGIPRLLELLRRKGVCGTFFVPAHTAVSFPRRVLEIREAGHEIASHGYCHESPVQLSRTDELQTLRRSIAKLRGVLGAAFQPAGYRSPAWDLSENSIAILEEEGYLYDSSLMAEDFRPYRPRRNDTVDDEKFTEGAPSRMVEMPVAWELDDYPYFHWASKPLNTGLRSTEDVLRAWSDEFDYCHHHVHDGVFTLTNHPEIIGRGPRISMLERLIDHMQSERNVVFSTLSEAAKSWDRRLIEQRASG